MTDDAQSLIGSCKKIWQLPVMICSSSRSARSEGLHNHSDLDVDCDDFLFFFLGGVFCIVFVFACFPPNNRHPVGSPPSLFYAASGTSNQVSCASDSTE